MVDEEFAVTVVGLVEERSGSIAFGIALEPIAFDVLCPKPRLHRTRNDRRDLSDRNLFSALDIRPLEKDLMCTESNNEVFQKCEVADLFRLPDGVINE